MAVVNTDALRQHGVPADVVETYAQATSKAWNVVVNEIPGLANRFIPLFLGPWNDTRHDGVVSLAVGTGAKFGDLRVEGPAEVEAALLNLMHALCDGRPGSLLPSEDEPE